jgi:N-acetylglucosaminyldiphosphoundecaprenol N-acetyl-beta-D-mannosaminyltransferase
MKRKETVTIPHIKPMHEEADWLSPTRVFYGAAPVDGVRLADAAQWLLEQLVLRQITIRNVPIQIMGPNAYLVTLAAKNRSFAQALNGASLCLPDGISVVWAARLLGRHIPERVPGGEFMERMCALCAEHGLTVYFLGGLPGAAEGAAQALTARYPGLQVVGTDCPPVGFEANEEMSEAVRQRIIAARPDLLCVAFGAPKQEIWMLDECPTLPIGAALSVGAALDTQAGLRRRAPAWTHNIGAEWLYRLAMEPRRLWRRYLLGNLEFVGIVLRTWSRQRRQQAMGHLLEPLRGPVQEQRPDLDEETRLLLQIAEQRDPGSQPTRSRSGN